jgi:hypothetical protein
MSDPHLQDHLCSLEERLLHPDRETDRSALIPLLAEEFREFGASGRIFNREQIIHQLLTSEPRAATVHHFCVVSLADNIALATYRVTTAIRVSHRSSLWSFRDNRWQILFHQGTIAT